MTKKANTYFFLIWPIVAYIIVEVLFQWQVRKTMSNFDGNSLKMLEWGGRFMFAASMWVFSHYLFGKKWISYGFAITAFLLAANIYSLVTHVIPQETKVNIEQNFIWSYRVGDLTNKSKIFDIMTIYRDENTAKRKEFDDYNIKAITGQFSEKDIHNMYEKINTFVSDKKKIFLKSQRMPYSLYEDEPFQKLNPKEWDSLLEKANMRFADHARPRLKVLYLNNPRPLGREIQIESGEKVFRDGVLEWAKKEIVNVQLSTKQITTEKMEEAAIMLPIALFLSSLGILMNSAILIFYTVKTIMNEKIALLGSSGYILGLSFIGFVAQTNIPTIFSGIIPIINVIGL